jgi:GntR family transcriptional regulator
MIDRHSHIPLYIQIKLDIKNKIKEGIYTVDGTIPSERELMDSYSVGRATIREAIGQLVTEGVLDKRQGIGTFVRKPKTTRGFMPFISLSYTLHDTGFDPVNEVFDKEVKELSDEEREVSKIKNGSVFGFKRIRSVDNFPVVLEKFTFSEEFIAIKDKVNLESSIGNIIVNELNYEVHRLEQDINLRKPTKREIELLKLDEEDEVLYTKRWMYVKGMEQPLQYYEMTVLVTLAGYPSKHFTK